ncbi:Acid sphingomyelinase-like phosphodiesterase 3b [Toxocara canis]|uniref:Acid sphingomyelinase-like phosphodiesterase 3b n=1 Tax=Toxocara canis TaxID=6265 RepID=A0A0B2VEJ3_TOXCA|nr:Acid sphingomyelinase-like phosphodiesterase 3b [Toxocara canis]
MRQFLVVLACVISSTKAAQFLQLTDFHLDREYSAQSGVIADKCHTQAGVAGSALGQFGDYACDPPETLIRSTLDAAKKIIPNPDFIFWTGDNIPHIDDYNESYVETTLQSVSDIIDSTYPNANVLPVFGNHDYAPSNAFPDQNCSLYNLMYNMWRHWIGTDSRETFLKGGYYKYSAPNNVVVLALNTNLYYKFNKAIPTFVNPNDPADQFKFMTDTLNAAEAQHQTVHETFLKGGYYKYSAPNNVVVLALNTNLYYKFNKAIPTFVNPNDPADQFKFMTDTLNAAEAQHQTVHVIAHIAPGVFERTPNFTWMLPQYNQRFIDITVRYASTIKWMLFGHHHTDTFHIVKDPATNNPVQVYLMAPAVTPWFSSLEGAGSNNPAFRVFDYNINTHELFDAKTYYIDLNELNKNSSAQWQLEYSMSQTYGINAINARTMNDVLNKLKTDNGVLMKYIEYNSVRWNYAMPLGRFRTAQLCALENPDFAGYDVCMKNGASVMITHSLLPMTQHSHSAASVDENAFPFRALISIQSEYAICCNVLQDVDRVALIRAIKRLRTRITGVLCNCTTAQTIR